MIGEVRKAEKKVHFTITSIGDEEELKHWRIYRKSKETRWQESQQVPRALRRERAISVLLADRQPRCATQGEKAEIAFLTKRPTCTVPGLSAWLNSSEKGDSFWGLDRNAEAVRFMEITQPSWYRRALSAVQSFTSDVWRNARPGETDSSVLPGVVPIQKITDLEEEPHSSFLAIRE